MAPAEAKAAVASRAMPDLPRHPAITPFEELTERELLFHIWHTLQTIRNVLIFWLLMGILIAVGAILATV